MGKESPFPWENGAEGWPGWGEFIAQILDQVYQTGDRFQKLLSGNWYTSGMEGP